MKNHDHSTPLNSTGTVAGPTTPDLNAIYQMRKLWLCNNITILAGTQHNPKYIVVLNSGAGYLANGVLCRQVLLVT